MRIALYLRQSMDRQNDGLAIDRQREQCMDLCNRRGWSDVTEFVDNDKSATKGVRPEYQAMLTAIETGRVDMVVVYDQYRLHRRLREVLEFVENYVQRYGIGLCTANGQINLTTADGVTMFLMAGVMAQGEVMKKAARHKLANHQKAKGGKPWRGRVFGYEPLHDAKGKLVGNVIVPAEADAIRTASTDLLNGVSLWAIAKGWNAAGLLTITGKPWTGGTVRQVLLRPRNAGLAVYGGDAPDTKDGKRIRPHQEGLILEGVETSWQPIVSRATFESVVAYLRNPNRHTGKSVARQHLLSGIAKCGKCGHSLSTGVRRTRRFNEDGSRINRSVYVCKNMACMGTVRNIGDVDRVVVKAITGRLALPNAAEVFAKSEVDVKGLTAEANRLRALMDAANADYDAGLIDGARLRGRLDTLAPKVTAIENTLVGSTVSRKLDGLIGNPAAGAAFDGLSLDRRRDTVATVASVTVLPSVKAGGMFDAERIAIEWR